MRLRAPNEPRRRGGKTKPPPSNAGTIELQVQYIATSELRLNPKNPHQHPEKQVTKIADSIREFGFLIPIIIDHEKKVLAGHARALAALKAGILRVPVIEVRHLSKAQLKAFAVADNKLSEAAHWDGVLLKEVFIEIQQLDPSFDAEVTGFTLPEIELRVLDQNRELTTEEEISSLSGMPVCCLGDVFQLGPHRVICADATKEASFVELLAGRVANIVFTDPPYNLQIRGPVSGKGRVKHREFAQASGELSDADFTDFLKNVLELLARFSTDGSVHFIFMDWRHSEHLLAAAKNVYAELKNIAVWAKNNGTLGSLYRSAHEFIFIYKSGTAPHTNNIQLGKYGRYRTNVWNYDSASTQALKGNNALELHPTAKPIDLVADALRDCSNRGETVLDVFLGCGTTLLAAERTERICYGIEIDPLYVDTAIRRWQNLAGHDAVRVSDGKTFREIEREQQAVEDGRGDARLRNWLGEPPVPNGQTSRQAK